MADLQITVTVHSFQSASDLIHPLGDKPLLNALSPKVPVTESSAKCDFLVNRFRQDTTVSLLKRLLVCRAVREGRSVHTRTAPRRCG